MCWGGGAVAVNPIGGNLDEDQRAAPQPGRKPWSTPRVILEENPSGTRGGPVTTANFTDFHSSPSVHTGPAS